MSGQVSSSLLCLFGVVLFSLGQCAQLAAQQDTPEAIQSIFESAKAQLVIEQGAGEGPAWHPEAGLHFSGGGNIHRWSKTKGISVFRKDAGTNGLYFDARLDLLACEPVRRVVSRTRNGKVEVLTARYQGSRYNQPNDLCVDSKGRIYFTDPKYGPRTSMEMLDKKGKKVEGVYRIDVDGSVTRIITHEVDRPNGIAVSADDRFLFVADNNNNVVGAARKLYRFKLLANGNVDLTSRKLLYDWGKSRGPDGMALDQKGRLYVAGGLNKANLPFETTDKLGGVYVFDQQGKFLTFVHIPRDEVTNCSFGGKNLKTLYVTAGGTLWSIRTKESGFTPWRR